MGSLPTSPSYAERLMAPLVDEIAVTDPTRVIYSFTKTNNPADGFRDVDAQTFARAINRCAWHLEQQLGPAPLNFPTLLYMGPQDIVYCIMVLASNKVGYKLLLSSPRNTLEAHLSLLEKTDCNTFLKPAVFPLPIVKQILDARKMSVVTIPTLDHWLQEGPVEPYPYTKAFAEARYDPLVVLHTSGSTGIPKPIIQTQSTNNHLDAMNILHEQGDTSLYPMMCANNRQYGAFPMFHCAGIVNCLAVPLFCNVTTVLGPFPPSVELINDILVHGNVQSACIAPSLLVEIANNPEYLENLSKLDMVAYGGGPVPKVAGEIISSRTKLINALGSTEGSGLLNRWIGPEYWAYLSYSPCIGDEFRPLGNGLYEHVIVRDEKLSKFQGVFNTFPDLQEWPMKDLYEKHPTTENVWLYKGRMDDIIVLSNGEKLNPLDMEDLISANSAVAAALVAGQGQFQASLLVEAVRPPSSTSEAEKLVDEIWPSVQRANGTAPSHGQIHRHMIIFTTAEKPMLRAGKGTVQRQLSVAQYEAELNALYKGKDQGSPAASASDAPSTADVSDEKLPEVVKRMVCDMLRLKPTDTDDSVDLFSLGLDSLQVTTLMRWANEVLVKQGKSSTFTTRDVYSNPTITSLAAAIISHKNNGGSVKSAQSVQDKLQKLFDLHTSNFPISGRVPVPLPKSSVVILTGATGSLGSYILYSLTQNPKVSHVYCLNRGTSSQERVQRSLTEKQLTVPSDKVTHIEAALSEPYFGLPMPEYKSLLLQITDVIHNAWPVNFNMPVESFNDQLIGLRRLVDFSLLSKHGSKLVFVSSVSAVAGLGNTADELVYKNWDAAIPTGYGQSKLLAERILDTASAQAGLDATICRVGQIAGSIRPGGMWPKQEWLPSLVISSCHLGLLPNSLGPSDEIDWVPVDIVAQSISDVALGDTSDDGQAAVYHIASHSRTKWSELTPTVLKHINKTGNSNLVSMREWVKALRESESSSDILKNPAVKLLDFYEGLASPGVEPISMKIKNALQASPTLEKLGAVQESWMSKWLEEWGYY